MANRLPELLHYLIWRCDPADLGATKLNKICWYADLDAYRRFGRTITGAATYIKLQHGPAPRNVHRVIDTLARDGKIAVSQHNYYGHPKTMYMSQAMPNVEAFSSAEVVTIDSVAQIICSKHTAASISELSHDPLWDEVPLGQEIPISAAAIIPGEITAEDITWAESAIAAFDEHRPAS